MAGLTTAEVVEDLAAAGDSDVVFTIETSSSTVFPGGFTSGKGKRNSDVDLSEAHSEGTCTEKTDKCESLEAYEQLARFVSASGQLKDIEHNIETLAAKLKCEKEKLVDVLPDSQRIMENTEHM